MTEPQEPKGGEVFEAHEERLRALIKRAEAPVLGLLGRLVPVEARTAIQADIRLLPSARAYAIRLDQYPALFGVWLAEHVMSGLGQDGHFSLYPYLQRAIGVTGDLSLTDKELLWRAFRRAMFKLGIQPLSRTSGTHFMADEYVRQAGVPIAFADDLATRMLQLARRLGLPDEDDQEGLMTWQSALLNKLGQPFSVTARKAVERDALGYYTRAFLRVHANGGRATSSDALEEALAKAFATGGATNSIRRAAIPQLLYRDGVLGVLFPATTNPTSYQLLCGSSPSAVRADTVGGFRPLPPGLHKEVSVLRSDGERVLSAKLWADAMSNRLLIFNAEGRLRAAAQLAQEETLELTPGSYVALCRFEPTNVEACVEVNESPKLVEVALEVRPGAEVVLENGPARLCIVGSNQPTFVLNGTVKGSLERLEVWYGAMDAAVEVPLDWREAGIASFELRVTSDEHRALVPVTLDSDGRARVRLHEAIQGLPVKPGLRRLVIELARSGDARTLQRQSILYWVGLDAVSYGMRFTYATRPQNLLVSSCAGLKLGDTHAEPTDDHTRVLRMAFEVGDGRLVHLSWNRPGVFVAVEVPSEDGASATISRPLGATEAVSLTSAKSVVVSASEPGYITLGSMRTFVDFSHRPSKVFPAGLLASRLEPGARTLAYEREAGGPAIPLLQLSQPHVVTEVKAERLANLLEVRVTVTGEPTDVAITGRELSSGRELRAEHELLAGTWHRNDLARMQVYSTDALGKHVIYVLLDVETLRPGVWLLGFDARVGGAWGRLEDSNEGRIAVAIAVDVMGKEVPGSQVVADAGTLELREVVGRLSRLNEHFRQMWSPACYEQQSWLGQYYTALVDLLRDHEADYVTELADMAMCRAGDDVRQGFIPRQSVPASLNRVFTQPRIKYRQVNSRPHPFSVALRAMPSLKGAVAPAFGLVLHPLAAVAFKNFPEVARGLRPKSFQLKAYREALVGARPEGAHQLDDELFLPKDGDLLGPLHLAQAWRDMERGLETSRLMQSPRKAAAIAMARQWRREQPAFDSSAPAGLRGENLVLDLRQADGHEVDDEEELKREHLGHIANACAWLAWHFRLEARSPGALAKLHAKLASLRRQVEVQGPVVSDCVGYYLHVAPAMFAFYLLLWELVLTIELDPAVQDV
ncbi:MAG: hypothetical protein JSR75_19580 [Proteobacteria bacterium]|nr:hypothetical protein [Pseudomonadota bacterium]